MVAPQVEAQTNKLNKKVNEYNMREGKELILATKEFATENRARSWWHLLSTLFILVGMFTAVVMVDNLFIKAALSIITGLVVVRLFIIYHDYEHHTILHKSKVANAIMTLFGLLVLAPKSIWKRSHDYHHANNSKLFSASIGSYPIATKSKFMAMSPSERRSYLAIRHPLTIALGYFSMFIIGMCLSSFLSTPKKHYDSLIALILHAAITTLVIIFGGWQMWIFTMLIPYMVACGMGAYLFYAQHNFPTTSFSENKDWKYEKAALESSSYLVMNPVMNWFTGNIGYHHIHHLNARIPFYRLPEAMAAMPELQNAKTTTLKLKDIIACFRLKVWDPELNRMVGFRELKPALSVTRTAKAQ